MASNPHIFVIGDTHLGHRKLVEPDTAFARKGFLTIEEHDEEIIRRWNDAVRPKDTVWHLGDVAFGRDALALCARLNGLKHLVMGNHDAYGIPEYQKYFSKIVGAYKLKGCILTHIPIHPSEFYRWKANVHGHLHSKIVRVDVYPDLDISNMYDEPDNRYINVSAEQINLTPVRLDLLLQKRGLK
jgi:calcineurin-like phosphoesterase family protein